MSGHTKGPWEIAGPHKDGYTIAGRTDNLTGPVLMQVVGTVGRKEDARLIASAPALLAALEECAELVKIARRYFPKSVKNADRFTLENTNAAIGRGLASAKGDA